MKISETVHFDWYKNLFVVLVLVACVVASATVTDADFAEVIQGGPQVTAFLERFMQPDFSYIPTLIDPMIRTIKMFVLGTVIGFAVAVPLAFLATTVVTRNQVVTAIFRFILDVVRTIPNLLLAALTVAIVGIGEFSGVITIAVFTLLCGLAAHLRDHRDGGRGAHRGRGSRGCHARADCVWLIAPQVMSQLASYLLMCSR